MEYIDLLSTRIDVLDFSGIVKYVGPLLHEVNNPRINKNDTWLGVEWDNPKRGTHNGTVGGVTYFKCEKEGNAGGLVKLSKVSTGVEIVEAYVKRYFKEEEANEILKNKENLVQFLIELAKNKDKQKEFSHDPEFDDEAMIKTSLAYKKIEFFGFDKIWNMITNVKKIDNLCLNGYKVSRIGKQGDVATLFTSVKGLSLEKTLMSSWDEVAQVAEECPNLELLWLNGNRMLFRDEFMRDQEAFRDVFYPDSKIVPKEPEFKIEEAVFKKLRMLALDSMCFTFKSFSRIAKTFPLIEQIVLSNNQCNDFDNLTVTSKDLPRLNRMDLSQNHISKTEGFMRFSELALNTLNLTSNLLERFDVGKFFPHLTHLNLCYNNIKDESIFMDLSEFKNLISIRMAGNPIVSAYDKVHIRFYLIACNTTLKMIEGSEIKRDERRDAEIYYITRLFKDFFIHTHTDQYSYDYSAFLQWSINRYPHVEYFIKRYGNPFPVEDRYLEARPNLELYNNQDNKKKNNVMIKFFKCVDGVEKLDKQKKFPISFDIAYVKTFCKNAMKLRKTPFQLLLIDKGIEMELSNNTALLGDYVSSEKVVIKVVIGSK